MKNKKARIFIYISFFRLYLRETNNNLFKETHYDEQHQKHSKLLRRRILQ